ncbi:MAG: head morphogenesis protein [Deltaproteobacteria bacterium]|nr:MAG: head morphogenesis protein [Deltaproteobacteria bacterium]
MPSEARYASLPFQEAIDFFREKVNIPTRHWDDLRQGMHARGFMVAGAAKTEILADLRSAVDKAISEGTTLDEFRKSFDSIVANHGWSYKGGRNWRSELIFSTNIRTAYAAGRYRQMTDPDVASYRPNWQYRHGDSVVPRPLHLSWDGLVLAADDAWWKTHYPPNGWGCKCRVFALSDRDMRKAGKDGPDTAPNDGSYEWTDRNGVVHDVPRGVDPGWDYNVGEAAWGRQLSAQSMADWRREGAAAWEPLTEGNWQSAGRPQEIPFDEPQADTGPPLTTRQAEQLLRKVLGGEEKIFSFSEGDFRYDLLVNAVSMAAHVPADRTPYLPLLEETLTDPFEVWNSFERHKGTGKVVLRQRVIKGVATEGGKGMLFVANAAKGILEGWTFVPIRNVSYLNDQRRGQLAWKR